MQARWRSAPWPTCPPEHSSRETCRWPKYRSPRWMWVAGQASLRSNVPGIRSALHSARCAEGPHRPRSWNLALRQQLALLRRRSKRPWGRSPRPRILDVALALVGTVARGDPCRSAADRDSPAPARLPLEIATRSNRSAARRFGDRQARPHHGLANPLWGAPPIHGFSSLVQASHSARLVGSCLAVRNHPRRPGGPSSKITSPILSRSTSSSCPRRRSACSTCS